ncbi:MAG: hypothetical protein ABI433_09705 [Burkholderiaceae bacterium]
MSAPTIHGCIAVLVALSLHAETRAQTQSAGIEFADLVRALMVPEGANPAQPGWALGTHVALRWQSGGPGPPAAALARDGLPVSRKALVQINVGGQPTHFRKPAQAGQWTVELAGSRDRPMEAHLSMDRQADAGIEPAAALRSAGFSVRALCKPGGISSGTAVFRIRAPGYHPAALAHEWSSGSAGTHVSLRLAYTQTRAARLRCE